MDYLCGRPRDENPYSEGVDGWAEWDEGWMFAEGHRHRIGPEVQRWARKGLPTPFTSELNYHIRRLA